MKKLLIMTAVLLVPTYAQAGVTSDVIKINKICVESLVAQAEKTQVTLNAAITNMIDRACKCAVNKTLNAFTVADLAEGPIPISKLKPVYDEALYTCIKGE